MSFEVRQSVEGQENLQDISQERTQLLDNIKQLTDQETDTNRAKLTEELAPKLVDLFASFGHVPDMQDLLMVNPETGRSVMQDTLQSLSLNHLQSFNTALDPQHPNFAKSQGTLANFFEEKIKIKVQTAKENKRQEKNQAKTDQLTTDTEQNQETTEK